MINVIIAMSSILIAAYTVAIADYFMQIGAFGRAIILIITMLVSVICMKFVSKFNTNKKQIGVTVIVSVLIILIGKDIIFPFYAPFNQDNEVIITATGDKNKLSNSNEVWINYIKIDGNIFTIEKAENIVGSWETKDGLLYYDGTKPNAQIKLYNLDDKEVQIEFSTHAWSGIVNIYEGKNTQAIDLYSEHPGVYLHTINNQIHSKSENNLFGILGGFILIFVFVTFLVHLNIVKIIDIGTSYLRKNIFFCCF